MSVAVVVTTRRVNAHQQETERRESLGVVVIHHAGGCQQTFTSFQTGRGRAQHGGR